MKKILLVVFALFISMPAHAKSYLVRTDGSVQVFDSEDADTARQPLRQNDIEEIPLEPTKEEVAAREKVVKIVEEEVKPRKMSDGTPLTQKEMEAR